MSNISTRRAEHKDRDAIAPLFDAYRQFYKMPSDQQRAAAYIQARIEKFESVIFVAENESRQIVGFCQLYPTFCSVSIAPIFTLYDLFIKPEVRRSGAGKALLTAAERYAAENGAVRMDLRTVKTNLPARSLYEALGWTRDDMFYAYSKVPGPQHR